MLVSEIYVTKYWLARNQERSKPTIGVDSQRLLAHEIEKNFDSNSKELTNHAPNSARMIISLKQS